MNEGDVIQRLGRPGIISHDYYRSRAWRCSACQLPVTSPEPIAAPPQCRRCGSIAFETVRAEFNLGAPAPIVDPDQRARNGNG
jgi:hypothetical protein